MSDKPPQRTMTTPSDAIEALLNQLLPDEIVLRDIAAILWKSGADAKIKAGRKWLTIPPDAALAVVGKAYFQERHIDYGPLRADVAIGEVEHAFGLVSASYCFASMFYDEEMQLASVSFDRKSR